MEDIKNLKDAVSFLRKEISRNLSFKSIDNADVKKLASVIDESLKALENKIR